MRHLGRNPQWLTLSKKVEFPPELANFYQKKLEEVTGNVEKEFAQILHDHSYILKPISLPPKGLINNGLMCFANSSLQLIFSSPKFVSLILYMKNYMRLFTPRQLAAAPAWHCLSKFARAFVADKYAFSTEILDEFFGPFSAQRKPLTQEDASEFTSYFLNKLHEEFITLESFGEFKDEEKGGWQAKGINTGKLLVSDQCVKKSPITDIFGCMVRADTLSNGKSRSIAHEPYLVLPLQITDSIDDSIKLFLSEEQVSETISKKNTILSLPSSIIIGLKRFAFDGNGPTKINDIVKYPKILTLFTQKFELSAIVIHIGSSSQVGHYICISNRADGKWREYDDESVGLIAENSELDRQAYMLLYNRIE